MPNYSNNVAKIEQPSTFCWYLRDEKCRSCPWNESLLSPLPKTTTLGISVVVAMYQGQHRNEAVRTSLPFYTCLLVGLRLHIERYSRPVSRVRVYSTCRLLPTPTFNELLSSSARIIHTSMQQVGLLVDYNYFMRRLSSLLGTLNRDRVIPRP